VPLALVNNNSPTVGEAGVGWNIPIAYVQQLTNISERKPKFAPTTAGVPASPPTEVSVRTVLDLGTGPVVMSLTNNVYRPVIGGSGGAGIELRYSGFETPSSADYWQAFDGSGHVFYFTKIAGLDDKTFWALTEIRDRTGENKVTLSYDVGKAWFPGSFEGEATKELLLTDVRYSFSDSGCAKHHVQLVYKAGNEILKDIPVGKILAYYVLGDGVAQVRTRLLDSVITWAQSDAACAAAPVRLKTVRLSYVLAADTGQPLLARADVWGQGDDATDSSKSRPIARFRYGSSLGDDGRLFYGQSHPLPLPAEVYQSATGPLLSVTEPDPDYWDWPSYVTRLLQDVTGDNRIDLLFLKDRWIYTDPTNILRFTANMVDASGTNGFSTPIRFWDLQNDSQEFGFSIAIYPFESRPETAQATWTGHQLIDWNGDGRQDVIRRDHGQWEVMINMPGVGGAIDWKPVLVDTTPLLEELTRYGTAQRYPWGQAGDHINDDWTLPIERTLTRDECWDHYAGGVYYSTCADDADHGPDFVRKHNDYQVVTEWKLMDVNGDSLPDFVFAAPSNQKKGNEDPGQDSTEVRVMYNRGGTLPFSGESVRLHSTTCGVERSRGFNPTAGQPSDPGAAPRYTYLSCGFFDVNGDGLVDFIDEDDRETRPPEVLKEFKTRVYLGTGLPDDFKKERSFVLPAPISVVQDFRRDGCPAGQDAKHLYQHSGLMDMTGDGIPDFVYHGFKNLISGAIPVNGVQDDGGKTERWWVIPGTGTGYAPPVRLDTDSGTEFQLNHSVRQCNLHATTYTIAATADIDGDGRVESVTSGPFSWGSHEPNLTVASLVSRRDGIDRIGLHDSTRLVEIDNGYGGTTRIEWGNAKAEGSTPHDVPNPEIVVTSVEEVATRGIGRSLAPVRYAYGYAQQTYNPLLDRWGFAGYGRIVTLSGIQDRAKGIVSGTAEVADQVRANELPATARSLDRMAFVGRTRDVHVFDGTFSTDPSSLLLLDTSGADSRLHSGGTQKWALVDLRQQTNWDNQDCLGHRGYGFNGASSDEWEFEIPTTDICASQVIPYVKEKAQWEGTAKPQFGVASDSAIQTHSITEEVDWYGRALLVRERNDVSTDSDDSCIRYKYAKGTREDMMVLDALANVHTVDCKSTSINITGERYIYDNKIDEEGFADRGFMTQVIQEVYDGTTLVDSHMTTGYGYDKYGNVSGLGRITFGDGVIPSLALTLTQRDPEFSIAVVSETTSAWGGSSVPALTTTIEPDPITLAPAVIHKSNGAIYKHQFDGFGRLSRSSTILGSGPEYLLSETTYADDPTDSAGIRTTLTAYASDTTVATAAPKATKSTVFYDEFGRTRYVQTDLGADYANRSVFSQYVKRDDLGRVVFRADPFQTSDIGGVDSQLAGLYGTTTYFHPDGRVRCEIQGNGPQALNTATSPADDRYPTCFSTTYVNSQLVSRRMGPNENLATDARYGAVDEVRHTAIGRLATRLRFKANDVLERASFGYDVLGNLSTITRFGKPATFEEPSTWSFKHDSLGRIIKSLEPAQAEKTYVYDTDSNLVNVTWPGPANHIKGVSSSYDAYGRLREQFETLDGTAVEGAYSRFHYDTPADSPQHVSPTNLLGRMSWAESAAMRTYFGYDIVGNTTSVAYVNAAENVPYVERRSYSSHGELEEIGFELPDQTNGKESVRYNYDSSRRVRSVDWVDSQGSESMFTATQVDDFGRYTNVAYANGVTEYWGYRTDHRHELQSEALTAMNGMRFRYLGAPDGEGRINTRTEVKVTNGVYQYLTSDYKYDGLNRLQQAAAKNLGTPTVDESYTYNPLGTMLKVEDNLGTAGDLSFSMDPLDRDRLCQSWNHSLEPMPVACDHLYDELGNVVATDNADAIARRFTYNTMGDVLTITKGPAVATFSRDAFGGIAELNVTGSTQNDDRQDRRYGDLIERAKFKKDGAWVELIERKIMGPMGVLARRRGVGTSAVTLYEHADHQGGRYFTDNQGMIIQEVEYSPFGNVTMDTGTPGDVRYTKDLWNEGDTLRDFGLTQLGPRLYDPRLRRFLQRDPLFAGKTASQMNPYAFAFNDPINSSDASGLSPPPLPDQETYDLSEVEFAFYLPGPQFPGWTFKGYFKIKATGEIRPGYLPTSPVTGDDIEVVRTASPSDEPTRGKDEPRTSYEWLADACSGFEKAGNAAVAGVLNAIDNPRGTAEGIWNAAKHPLNTTGAILKSGLDTLEKVNDGDPEAIGALAANIALSFVPAPPLGKLLGEIPGAARLAGRLEKIASKLDHLPCPCRCFAAGTLIHTEDGLTPIEDIEPGMLVWSRDEATGDEGYKPVVQVFVRPDQPTVGIVTLDDNGTIQQFEATYDHPLYTGRGWVHAGNLSTDDVLFTRHSGWLRVSGVFAQSSGTTVYNFEVADDHTYFVADVGVWGHNACCRIPNPFGAGGKPDHVHMVEQLVKKAEGELGPGETVLRERQLQGHPSTRKPDVQIVDEAGKTRKVFEAERHPGRKRNIDREAEYDGLGIENETHPLK
jgi:RHS repeat-associated protein